MYAFGVGVDTTSLIGCDLHQWGQKAHDYRQ